MFMVTYRDDYNQKHLIFVEADCDINFLKSRFDEVIVRPIETSFVFSKNL